MSSYTKTFGPVASVIGAQWGDEGKGKVVDMLAKDYDVLARACGGANAGHTIVVDGQKHVFHLLPSGCLHPEKQIVLGSGVVIHLPTLIEEIDTLEEHGINIVDRLFISEEAHIVFDYHKEVDAALEAQRSDQKGQGIGTTKRGIGPAYMDKAERIGIRMESIDDDLHAELKLRVPVLKKCYNVDIDIDAEIKQMKLANSKIGKCVTNTTMLLHKEMDEGKTILIEGAQATLLDIDHGTYPYVTSSSTTLAGALQGLGLPPRCITSCIGVAKAYCTRVGSGTFPTEANEEDSERLRQKGGEFGATTGRPRRVGWLSIDDLQYVAKINGFTHWNITKLDVLDDEETIPIELSGEMTAVEGWRESTAGLSDWKKLPKKAQRFIETIEKHTKTPVAFIGTGQGREEMIYKT